MKEKPKSFNNKTGLLNHVLGVLTCSRALRVYVLACLGVWHACVLGMPARLRVYVLGVLVCLHASVLGVFVCLACLRAYMHGVLACVRACVVVTMKCFIFLGVCGLGVGCAFLSYLLCISILKFKNSWSKQIVCFVKLNTFLIYILIPTYKGTNLRVAEKSIDISYSYSCSKAISIFYNLYIRLLH